MTSRLNVAITCFPTFGGSGAVASEVGLALAAQGHRVHFIARELPFRLQEARQQVHFHQVKESAYPVLMQSSAYPIALASKMIEVARQERLDILHVHYAVPHATAAWMAKEVMGPAAPKVVTTLHGTDITLVGIEPNHLPITRFSVLKSDAVSTPSRFLRDATYSNLGIPLGVPIDVIPNFLDAHRFMPRSSPSRPQVEALFPSWKQGEPVLIHVSNFRPVKRIQDVVAIFASVAAQVPCRLVMVGDGPERPAAEAQVHTAGLEARVAFVGTQDAIHALLPEADVFLLPSETESFGLAALEAMACGVPVVASRVGGLPEVVRHGEDGWLAPVGDVTAMAAHVVSLLRDGAMRSRFSLAARAHVLEHFQLGPAVAAYEALYRRVLQTR